MRSTRFSSWRVIIFVSDGDCNLHSTVSIMKNLDAAMKMKAYECSN
jgi:hypothetical protein